MIKDCLMQKSTLSNRLKDENLKRPSVKTDQKRIVESLRKIKLYESIKNITCQLGINTPRFLHLLSKTNQMDSFVFSAKICIFICEVGPVGVFGCKKATIRANV